MQKGKPSLKNLLAQHAGYDKQLQELLACASLDSFQIQEIKKKKLAVKDDIAHGRYTRRTAITSVDVYPLTDETLELLKEQLQADLAKVATRVNPSSQLYVNRARELNAVLREQERRANEVTHSATAVVTQLADVA